MFSQRTRLTLGLLQYNAVFFVLIAFPTFYYFYYYARPHHRIDEALYFDFSCLVALLALLPGEGVLWFNALCNLWPPRPHRYRNSTKVRNFSRMLICMASKGDNIDVSPSLMTSGDQSVSWV